MVEPKQKLSLLSVLGELVQPNGTRSNVKFTAGDGTEIRVNLEVTDATRPILNKGADTGAMTTFKPCDGEYSSETLQHSRKLRKFWTKLKASSLLRPGHENKPQLD